MTLSIYNRAHFEDKRHKIETLINANYTKLVSPDLIE